MSRKCDRPIVRGRKTQAPATPKPEAPMTQYRTPDAKFRTSRLEENEGPAINPTDNRTMGEIIAARFSRRGFLKGSLAVSAIAATVSPLALVSADEARAA